MLSQTGEQTKSARILLDETPTEATKGVEIPVEQLWAPANETVESEKPEKLEKPEEEKEESSKASAIREALNGGVVRRAKHEGKSLEVKDPITVKPLFEAPAIPSLFDDDSAIPSSVQDNSAEPKGSGSHLLDELSEGEAGSEVESEADDALLDHPAENEPAGENPWLAAARDNVSHGERGAKEKEEDGVDVQAAVARLEVGKRGKPER